MTLFHQSPAIFSAWVVWCGLHSLLASSRVRKRLARTGLNEKKYRLYYVLFSLTSLAVIIAWELATLEFPRPRGIWWQAARALLFSYGGFMFMAGGRVYDLKAFSGLSQLGQENDQEQKTTLKTSGILARVRHPWYSGGLALIAGLGNTPLDRIDLRIFLAVYMVLGCMIEEKRLLREFGEKFSRYQKKVPMLIPLPRR